MANFDPEVFNANNIYSGSWNDSAGGYVKHYLETFVSIIRQVAEQGKGIAVFLG